jgi:hypothetical protein
MAYVQHGKSSAAEYIHAGNCMISSSHAAAYAWLAAQPKQSIANSISSSHLAGSNGY